MYVFKDEDRSPLEVMRKYQVALEGAGFEPLFVCANDECAEGAAHTTYHFYRANPNLRLRCKVPDLADWGQPNREPRYWSARLARPGEGTIHVAVTVAAWKLRGGGGPGCLGDAIGG